MAAPAISRKVKDGKVFYIDTTPSWEAVVCHYLMVLEDPRQSPDMREEVKAEIVRCAKAADYMLKHINRRTKK